LLLFFKKEALSVLITLGIVGSSGSGKTTLVVALIEIFKRRGFSVSSVKHAHHNLTLDKPGKDSFRHAQAGAAEVILATGGGFALFAPGAPPRLEDLLARLSPVDLVLVEGYKSYNMPKLEVFRPALGQAPLWPTMPVLAVASDTALPDCPAPVLDLNTSESVADFLMAALGLNRLPSA
jgi:molybdopterin-guanine dinucleotide biosynthesis protein B